MSLSPAEQFDVINTPTFFDDLKGKVNAIRSALGGVSATAPSIATDVNEVPVEVSFISENEGLIKFGRTSSGGWQYESNFPIRWLEPVS